MHFTWHFLGRISAIKQFFMLEVAKWQRFLAKGKLILPVLPSLWFWADFTKTRWKEKVPHLVNSLPQVHLPGFPWTWGPWWVSAGCRDRRLFEGPHRSCLEVSRRHAQNVPSKPWFYTTVCLQRKYKFMHVDARSQTGSCPNRFSLPWIYAGVSDQQQMPPGPARSGWKRYPPGVGTGLRHVSPESRDADHACRAAPALAQLFRYDRCS